MKLHGVVLTVALTITGALCVLTHAEVNGVDFDQGLDATAIVNQARQQVAQQVVAARRDATAPQRVCMIHFKAPSLELKNDVRFAHARYIVDQNCEPRLAFAKFSQSIPGPAHVMSKDPVLSSRTATDLAGLPTAGATANLACTVVAWEQEVVYKRMIEIQNATTRNTDGESIQDATINAQSTTYFSWWNLIAGPFAEAWWVVEYTAAHTLAQASFDCNGGPFCQSGPSYPMTLKAETDIFANGRCSGYATYDGQLTPGGAFDYMVSR
ncbi:MAG: hypothetical protein HY403_12060 [Elusimicrobia bacterium]|nr:hypothetical protein [Elusimicrobiota bacterium]